MKKYVIHGVTWAGEDIPLVSFENEIEADTALSQFETYISQPTGKSRSIASKTRKSGKREKEARPDGGR